MQDQFYQMYLDEIEGILPCGPEEERLLLARISQGDEAAKTRLIEGTLEYVAELVSAYENRGLPLNDLVQEANVALLLAVDSWKEGEFRTHVRGLVEAAVTEALDAQETENRIEEEALARVNVLKDISAMLAEKLGREATVEELAETMKMTVQEIKDIMKLTLDAMSVHSAVENE